MKEFSTGRLLHTPEGVRDIYGAEYAKKRTVTDCIRNNMLLYGYVEIQTPVFEYFDVFSNEIGTTPAGRLYKFFDKDGNTLTLRPDFTPSAARCAAKYYRDRTDPIRLCYEGSAFVNTSDLQGKLKETTQMGVELIGDDSPQADAEAIALLVHCLRDAGLPEFKISLGNADYFRGLCEALRMDSEMESALRTELIGPGSTLDDAAEEADNERSLRAVSRLRIVYDILKLYGVEDYVSFDLSMLSKYNYYTGIIFRGFTYGVGDVVATGGRYDNLLGHFGKDAPAIGFMIPVDTLMEALRRQHREVKIPQEAVTVTYDGENFEEKLELVEKLRRSGTAVRLIPEKPMQEQ